MSSAFIVSGSWFFLLTRNLKLGTRNYQAITAPPSTLIACPVISPAFSDASVSQATSAGAMRGFCGEPSANNFKNSSMLLPVLSAILRAFSESTPCPHNLGKSRRLPPPALPPRIQSATARPPDARAGTPIPEASPRCARKLQQWRRRGQTLRQSLHQFLR